ncbi:2,4'-dihydroxyacetophenone dioxygenase family protein [Marinicaulis aureus]|uniref:2,4'-dihydroxyacetophenone dioxygenase family protein n=1 Tax=Hyphococcus aureus TaxID=2666033 RepID=A0ABW1KY60_9PROT
MLKLDPAEAICLNDEDTPWIPFDLDGSVALKYFHINPVKGEIVLLAKNKAGVKLPRHYHTGQVIVYTVAGYWKYAEHDWTAGPGSVVYEVAGSEHQPIILPDHDVLAVNIVQGESFFYDENGTQLGAMNCDFAMTTYLKHCEENGIKPKDLTTFNPDRFS